MKCAERRRFIDVLTGEGPRYERLCKECGRHHPPQDGCFGLKWVKIQKLDKPESATDMGSWTHMVKEALLNWSKLEKEQMDKQVLIGVVGIGVVAKEDNPDASSRERSRSPRMRTTKTSSEEEPEDHRAQVYQGHEAGHNQQRVHA